MKRSPNCCKNKCSFQLILNTLILTFTFSFCSTGKIVKDPVTESEKVLIEETKKEQPNSILFLSFLIAKDSLSGQSTLTLIDKKSIVASLKNNQYQATPNENSLSFEVMKDNEVVQFFYIEHPLLMSVEYEEGVEMKRNTFEFQKREFFVRMQISNGQSKVRISEIIKNKEKKNLLTIDLTTQ
ncbi:MAG: hypothetical protein ABIO44_10880 [Saprospiraceae bacterium]